MAKIECRQKMCSYCGFYTHSHIQHALHGIDIPSIKRKHFTLRQVLAISKVSLSTICREREIILIRFLSINEPFPDAQQDNCYYCIYCVFCHWLLSSNDMFTIMFCTKNINFYSSASQLLCRRTRRYQVCRGIFPP